MKPECTPNTPSKFITIIFKFYGRTSMVKLQHKKKVHWYKLSISFNGSTSDIITH